MNHHCHRGCGRPVAVEGALCGPAAACSMGAGHPGWTGGLDAPDRADENDLAATSTALVREAARAWLRDQIEETYGPSEGAAMAARRGREAGLRDVVVRLNRWLLGAARTALAAERDRWARQCGHPRAHREDGTVVPEGEEGPCRWCAALRASTLAAQALPATELIQHPRLRKGALGWKRALEIIRTRFGLDIAAREPTWRYSGSGPEGHAFQHPVHGQFLIPEEPRDFYPVCAPGLGCGLAGCPTCSRSPTPELYERMAFAWMREA